MRWPPPGELTISIRLFQRKPRDLLLAINLLYKKTLCKFMGLRLLFVLRIMRARICIGVSG